MSRSVRVPNNIGWYLSGFSDGEGSFNISLRKKTDYKIRWQPVLSFNVSQREKTILTLLKRYLQCGIIKKRQDGLHSYDVTNPNALHERVIPFFVKYRFLSSTKKRNFSLFKKAVFIMYKKQHLTESGFVELLLIREKLNEGKGRTRKYNLEDVLESSETIRQAYENRMR